MLLAGILSTLGRPAPSLNERLNLDYALPHGQVFDLRVENYYDGDDEADVWRVRAGLRRLGITQPLSWRGDQATRDGQYQVRGSTQVSRYRG